ISKDDEMNKLLKSKHNILFQSATPRIYDLEGTDYDDDIENLLGKIAYKMDFKTAFDNKYICDYKIYLPYVSESKKYMNKLINKEIDVSGLSDDIKAKCTYLYKCMLYNGSRKCIVYLTDINEVEKFKV